MGVAVKQPGNVIIYRISDNAQGVWWPDKEPMPEGYSLVPAYFPTMKPTTLKGIPGMSENFVASLKNPKNLIIIGGIVGLIFFRKSLAKVLKPLSRSFKKVGRKVGVK